MSLSQVLDILDFIFQFLCKALTSARQAKTPNFTSHPYMKPGADVSRSPCPALNALANQGDRSGTNISFWALFLAVQFVYNLSFPLTFLLTFYGFFTSGEILWRPFGQLRVGSGLQGVVRSLFPMWTINLAALSKRGPSKIAHNSSFVHPDDKPSTSPDAALLANLLHFASHTNNIPGLTLRNLALFHDKRKASSNRPLNLLHEQIALGECGLTWLVMHEHCASRSDCRSLHDHHDETCKNEPVIPLARLEQWFGEERLPDNWWEGVRPINKVGLRETRRRSEYVARVT